jgi:hypothetical protein
MSFHPASMALTDFLNPGESWFDRHFLPEFARGEKAITKKRSHVIDIERRTYMLSYSGRKFHVGWHYTGRSASLTVRTSYYEKSYLLADRTFAQADLMRPDKPIFGRFEGF